MMRTILFLLCIILSIKLIHSTQCKANLPVVGPCGCCPLIGGHCIYYETIDGVAATWHVCVPEHLKKTFSLEQCKPKIHMGGNFTRICRTKNITLRLFPQCATNATCFLPIPPRSYVFRCDTPMAVTGTCKKSIKSFTYDSQQRKCVPFTYTGCGGTTNRFNRLEQCEKSCIKSNKTLI